MRVFRRGNVYWFELVFKGKRYQESTKSKNARVAGQIASTFHAALVKGEVGITERKPVPHFKAAMQAFLAWSSIEHHAHPGTTERYRYSSMPLLAHFKDLALDRVGPEQVDEYKQKRAKARRKAKKKENAKLIRPATVNRELACLRAMFNHAIKACPDLRNPISKLTGVKLLAENNQQDRVLTYTEEAAYLAAAKPTLRDVATLILKTGMRPEEVFELQASQVDLEHGYLRVLQGKTKAARRRIELTPAAAEMLARRIKTTPAGYLFPCKRDASRPLPGVQSAHARALKNSGVARFRPYDLRHTWATRAAEAGVDLITLAAMMGHSRIQMVLRYAHPTQEHQTGAMAKVLEHEKTQRARETLRQQQAESRPGLRLVPKSA